MSVSGVEHRGADGHRGLESFTKRKNQIQLKLYAKI